METCDTYVAGNGRLFCEKKHSDRMVGFTSMQVPARLMDVAGNSAYTGTCQTVT